MNERTVKMKNKQIKITLASINIKQAQPVINADKHIDAINSAFSVNSRLIVFSELSLTGVCCGDLFTTSDLIQQTNTAVCNIIQKTAQLDIISVIGAPVVIKGRIYNCALVLKKGNVLGIIPKVKLSPDEQRYFNEGIKNTICNFGGCFNIAVGDNLIFCCQNMPEFSFCVDVGALTDINAPSCINHGNANIVVNLGSDIDYAGKSAKRDIIVQAKSDMMTCAYIYNSNSLGESTADYLYANDKIAGICGQLNKSKEEIYNLTIDLEEIASLRYKKKIANSNDVQLIEFITDEYFTDVIKRRENPFIPESGADEFLAEVLEMQCKILQRRLEAINAKSMVLGISGGLDSTMALVVCAEAAKRMNLPPQSVIAVTLPAFGTTSKSLDKSKALIQAFGCEMREIDIKEIVTANLNSINHSFAPDVTYENSQARERTAILMNIANMTGGIMIGTSDLSETALGFSTYGGDQMSMYEVNSSLPKTVIREIIRYYGMQNQTILPLLQSVIDAPISPELLPVNESGEQLQETEKVVGDYNIIDFIMYYYLKHGFNRQKLLEILTASFGQTYNTEYLENTLNIFFNRFNKNQFKRNCMPDGAAVMEISLSPRGGFNMPSDL